jgi:hypothetical protein
MFNILYRKKIMANEVFALKVIIFFISYFNKKKKMVLGSLRQTFRQIA